MKDTTRLNTQLRVQTNPEPFPDLKYTETTRYLCAAAHLDKNFRNYVIKHIIEEEHKAIAESPGVDAVSVVKHCLAAKRRETFQNIVLAVILFVAVSSQVIPQRENYVPLILCFILTWAFIFLELSVVHYSVIANLTEAKFNPDAIDFQLDPSLEQKIANTTNVQTTNLVVYSGFTPFVGAGTSIGGWSFALNVQKGKQNSKGETLQPDSFETREMYAYLTDAVTKLGIDGLSVKDRLFVDGREIRGNSQLLPDPFIRPVSQVSPSLIEKFIENPSQSIRHYKCIQITSWKGELVLSIFLRLSKVGQSIFIEASYFLLPPVRERYYKIDATQPTRSKQKIRELLVQSAAIAPVYCLLSPFELLRAILHPFQRRIRLTAIRREISENSKFDYGAERSIRVYASASAYRQFFQRLDKEMYVKIVERQLLDSIIDFLDKQNIDTTDLREQRTMILNSGVIVSDGGSINAETIALSGAKVSSFGAAMAGSRGTQHEAAK